MKRYIFLAILLIGSITTTFAQSKMADTIQVSGVCDMCKKRIEQALDVKGIWIAEWNATTQKLYVVYKPKKISRQEIGELLAAVGHDNEIVQATDEVYDSIHGCCKYRAESTHKAHQTK
jgi:periplasmic mercuric ion binding protein